MLLNGVRVAVVVGALWTDGQARVGAGVICTPDIMDADGKGMYEWQFRQALRREQKRLENTSGKTEAFGSGDNAKRGSNNDPLWVSCFNLNLFEHLAHRRPGSERASVKSA